MRSQGAHSLQPHLQPRGPTRITGSGLVQETGAPGAPQEIHLRAPCPELGTEPGTWRLRQGLSWEGGRARILLSIFWWFSLWERLHLFQKHKGPYILSVSGPAKLGEGRSSLHWTTGAPRGEPQPAGGPLPSWAPCFLCFYHGHRPGWALAKPSLAGEGQARAVPGSAEALGQEQQSRPQESWGLSYRPAGTQVSASCASLEMRGTATSLLPRAVM